VNLFVLENNEKYHIKLPLNKFEIQFNLSLDGSDNNSMSLSLHSPKASANFFLK
jgi:hypothetical protein